MRYAQRGEYTPAEQRRERLQMEAAERFDRGGTIKEVARDLRVTSRSTFLRGRREQITSSTAATPAAG